MKPQEAIGIMKIAISEVEWEYPMDYPVAFEEAIKALKNKFQRYPIMKVMAMLMAFSYMILGYVLLVVGTMKWIMMIINIVLNADSA